MFIEFKRPGKEPAELQWNEIREMRAHGADVLWLSDAEDFLAVIRAREQIYQEL